MLLVRTTVRSSDIDGLGVFAAEPIPAGTEIWRLEPALDRVIPSAEIAALPASMREMIARYAYPSPDTPGHVVYEVDNGRFMNHSDRPNTDFSGADRGVAMRDIRAGEELTCDYAEFYEGFAGFDEDKRGEAAE